MTGLVVVRSTRSGSAPDPWRLGSMVRPTLSAIGRRACPGGVQGGRGRPQSRTPCVWRSVEGSGRFCDHSESLPVLRALNHLQACAMVGRPVHPEVVGVGMGNAGTSEVRDQGRRIGFYRMKSWVVPGRGRRYGIEVPIADLRGVSTPLPVSPSVSIIPQPMKENRPPDPEETMTSLKVSQVPTPAFKPCS